MRLNLGGLLFAVLIIGSVQAQAQTTVLRGARLIDGTGSPAIEKSVLVIEGSRIKAVGREGSVRFPKGAKIVDASGETLMPLLICLHGHLGQTVNGAEVADDAYTAENVQAQLEQYLRYGVGAVISLGTDWCMNYAPSNAPGP